MNFSLRTLMLMEPAVMRFLFTMRLVKHFIVILGAEISNPEKYMARISLVGSNLPQHVVAR